MQPVKTCCQCGETKPLDAFYRRAGTRDGRMARCGECHNKYGKTAKAKEASRQHYQANREKICEYWRDKYQQNPQFYKDKTREAKKRALEKNPNIEKERRDKWTDEQRWRYGMVGRKNRDISRARRFGVPSEQDIDYVAIGEAHLWMCHICGRAIEKFLWRGKDHLSFDHIVPMSRGGPNFASNIAPAHFGCNASKKDSLHAPKSDPVTSRDSTTLSDLTD